MKGIKYIETLTQTFKRTMVDAEKNEPKIIFKTAFCSLFAALNRSKSIYPSENAEETKFEETSFRIGAVCICLYSVQVFFLLFFFFFLQLFG